MKSKKADITLNETLGIVLSIVGILLLVGFAWLLYSGLAQESEMKKARATLDGIFEKLQGMEEGDSAKYLVTGPKNWDLVSYKEGESMPKSCFGKNCLCICYGNCDELGVCENVKNRIFLIPDCSSKMSPAKDDPSGRQSKLSFEKIPLNLYIEYSKPEFFKDLKDTLIISFRKDCLKNLEVSSKTGNDSWFVNDFSGRYADDTKFKELK